MSLFKARDWWSTTSGFEEFHDLGCLCVGNIDNNPSGYDKLIVGSFQGLVRIYEPHPPLFTPSHVILEQQLGQPVIQLALGRFIQGSTGLHLAVLHPHQLSVHTLVVKQTSSESEPVFNFALAYSHPLKRTACNMTWGPFENPQGSDHICVQSMDGQLSFFNNITPTFTCFVPDFLLPGPIGFIQQIGCLVTINSAHMMQTFKYQSLTAAGTSSEMSQPGGTASSAKKIPPFREVNLGEHALQLQVVAAPTGPQQILVLGERSLFCITPTGVVRFMKKLDFSPSCLHCFHSAAPDGSDAGGYCSIKTLLASHTNQLLVLKDSSLIWAASLDYTPVDLSVASFQEQNGVIVTLDELGHVNCSYLGTDPSLFSVALSTSRDPNFEEMERELNELNKAIKSTSNEGIVVKEQPSLKLRAVFQPEQVREMQMDDTELEFGGGGGRASGEPPGEERLIKKCLEVQVHVESTSGPALRDVVLSIVAPLPLTTHPSHFVLPTVSSNEMPHPVTVVCTPSVLPTTTSLTLSATYRTLDGSLQVCKHEVELPLHLFCEPLYPEKNANFKVTLDVSPFEPNVPKLFPPQLTMEQGPPQALGLRYLCGSSVTLVASKGTQRYRLQSNSLSALGCTMTWLLPQLDKRYKQQTPPFTAQFVPPLPLNEYFEVIDQHFKLRKNVEQCREWLGRHAHQFRAIQKRLLTRFKDKTPVGLAHLDTLLDGTYMQLMALTDKSELLDLELQECSNQLSCATSLICILLRLSTGMNDEDYAILTAALSPIVPSDGEQGWEEVTDVAVTHLLQTTMAKSTRDERQVASNILSLELPADCQKLKKRIALLCDRITKGFMPSGMKTEPKANRSLSVESAASDDDDDKKLSQGKGLSEDSSDSLSGGGGYWKQLQQGMHPMPALPEGAEESSSSEQLDQQLGQ